MSSAASRERTTAADSGNPLTKKYLAEAKKYYPDLSAGAASLFSANYWNATWPVLQALKVVKGDLSDKAGQVPGGAERHRRQGLQLCRGADQARQQPATRSATTTCIQLTSLNPETYKTLRTIPNVDQSFSGFFTTKTPTPGRNISGVRQEDAALMGRQVPERSAEEVGEPAVTAAAPTNAEPILRLRGVGRRFGGVQAVRDVDLDVAHGERRAILGPNGAGKTTLFNVIAGDFKPTTGTIELMGHDVTNLAGAPAPEARPHPDLPEVEALPRSLGRGQPLSGDRWVRNGGHLRPLRTTKDRRVPRSRTRGGRARRGSTMQLSTPVGSLSHGEQRQLEVGMARRRRAAVMMLDEPASGPLARGARER